MGGREHIAMVLAGHAADAGELREWLEMTGLVPGKFCPGCSAWKPVAGWSRNRAHPDGLASYCKACAAVRLREYREDRAGKPDLRLSGHRPPRAGPPALRQVGAKVPPELAELVAADAAARGVSVSEVVRGILAGHYAAEAAAGPERIRAVPKTAPRAA
jgi:hypothetical protein